MTSPTELLARQREREQAATPGPWTGTGSPYLGRDTVLIIAARNDRSLLLDVVEAAHKVAECSTESARQLRPDLYYAALDWLDDALSAVWKAWEEAER